MRPDNHEDIALLKLVDLLIRKPGMTRQAFHDHWRHPHGTLAMQSRFVRRYVQNHRIDSVLVNSRGSPFDGVVEAWFDSEAAVAQSALDPFVIEHMNPDASNFLDRNNPVRFLAEEEVLFQALPEGATAYDADWSDHKRPISIKLFQFIECDGNDRWDSMDDAELGRRIGAFRHVRSRPIRGEGPFVGMRELWWPTLTMFNDGIVADANAWSCLRSRPKQSYMLLARAERLV